MVKFRIFMATIGLLIVVTQATGCTQMMDSSNTSASEVSHLDELTQALQEDDEGPAESSDSISTSDSTLESLQGKTAEDILKELSGSEYVHYFYENMQQPENMALLDRWVENYYQGIPSTVWVLQDTIDSSADALLFESDGTECYTIYSNHFQDDWETHTSSIVVKRDTDYLFGTDRPVEEWFDFWQYHTLRHTDIVVGILEESSAGESLLDDGISPEDAIRIAALRDEQLYKYIEQNLSGNFSGAGQYFPLDLECSIEEHILAEFEILGEVQINDEPFYKIGRGTPDEGYGYIYAVDAHTGNIMYSESVLGSGYSMIADAGQELISLNDRMTVNVNTVEE